MASTTQLPRFLVLKATNGQFLRLKKYPDSYNVPVEELECTGEEVRSPLAKFEVEKRPNGVEYEVHIRSCYTNKYLAADERANSWLQDGREVCWMCVRAEKPVEDGTKKSCTLFRPYFDGKTESEVRFRSIGPRLVYQIMSNGNYLYFDELYFKVVDLTSLVILPKRVAFKSLDGNYLVADWESGHHNNYLRILSNYSAADPKVANEVSMTRDGNLRIKNEHYGKYWRATPGWIWADAADQSFWNWAEATDDSPSDQTLFIPTRCDNNVIALKSMVSNRFVGPLSVDGKTHCLNAHIINATSKEAQLVVEELVLSRSVSNIQFRLPDQRIYDEQVLENDASDAVNNNKDGSQKIGIKYTYTDIRSTTWSTSNTYTFGVKTTLEVKAIPFIVDGHVEISGEFSHEQQWGGSKETHDSREHSTEVDVPPMSKRKVILLVTRAKCDVPFSYDQRDVWPDGRVTITTMDDGIFTGINSFQSHWEYGDPHHL